LGGGAVALFYSLNKWSSPTDGRTSKTSSPSPEAKNQSALPDKSPSPRVEPSPTNLRNLTGEWRLVNIIEKTSYPQYANLRPGYRLAITQTGRGLTAEGEKLSENDRSLETFERTPIHVTGWVNEDGVSTTFVEEGSRRKTSGRFDWSITTNGNQLSGTFVSTAAKSSGSSVATRAR